MKHLLLALLLSIPFCSNGQNELIWKTFPPMDVEAINDSKVKLPDSVMGKYTLLGLAYSKKAEEELMDWSEPVFKKFVLKTGGLLQGFGHDVNVFFIPLFTGINAAGGIVKMKISYENRSANFSSYSLVQRAIKTYKESPNFDERDTALLLCSQSSRSNCVCNLWCFLGRQAWRN